MQFYTFLNETSEKMKSNRLIQVTLTNRRLGACNIKRAQCHIQLTLKHNWRRVRTLRDM